MLKLKKGMSRALIYFIEIFVIVISVFPILWVIMSAFKTNGEILSSPLALPSSLSPDTFIHLFENYSFPPVFSEFPGGGGSVHGSVSPVLCHGRICSGKV